MKIHSSLDHIQFMTAQCDRGVVAHAVFLHGIGAHRGAGLRQAAPRLELVAQLRACQRVSAKRFGESDWWWAVALQAPFWSFGLVFSGYAGCNCPNCLEIVDLHRHGKILAQTDGEKS